MPKIDSIMSCLPWGIMQFSALKIPQTWPFFNLQEYRPMWYGDPLRDKSFVTNGHKLLYVML